MNAHAIPVLTLEELNFSLLNKEFDLSTFECGDTESDIDISNFLKDDALDYQEHHIANTYLFFEDDQTIAAYFCISNDCLNDEGQGNNIWNRFHRKQKIPNEKRIRQYPSIKIGRLAVHSKYKGTGLAYQFNGFYQRICNT